MMDKSREVEEQNTLRDWRRQNCDEVKDIATKVENFREIDVQVKKFTKWKGFRNIFSPYSSY